MSLVRPQRGRPKGTGINDRPRLRGIAELLVRQPQIRPTTAIRMLGETDPSVIRRLRDKFFAMQEELMAEVRGQTVGSSVARAAAPAPLDPAAANEAGNATPAGEVLRLAIEQARGSLRPAPPAAVLAASPSARALPAAEVTSSPREDARNAVSRERVAELAAYNVMLGLAIQASVGAFQGQLQLGEQALRLSPIAALLRQQIEIGETIMSLAWPPAGSRSAAACAA